MALRRSRFRYRSRSRSRPRPRPRPSWDGPAIGQGILPVPCGVWIWVAIGHTEMRRGIHSLALQVQQSFGLDPFFEDLYI